MTQQHPPFGVLLANLGTPEAPTPNAVRKYLAEFLWDKRVVDTARPLWWLILHGVILRIRPGPVSRAYASVWTDEGSPLMVNSLRQEKGLQIALSNHFNCEIPVALSMTYGEPSMEQAGTFFRESGIERLLVLPLYPQYSSSTTAAVFDRLAKSLKNCPHLPAMRFINEYHLHPLYIQALANSVKEHWKKNGKGEKLMMSFHGIPERYAVQGDPYPEQCRATARALAASLQLDDGEWRCTFQSRFGREEWVKPYTDVTLIEWAKKGLSRVDVISPAFSADCLETLEELVVENKNYFINAGGSEFHYIPCLNDRDDHINMMVQLVDSNTVGWQ